MKYLSFLISVLIFIVFVLFSGPSTLFGLVDTIQNGTGFYFGINIATCDYFIISTIPALSFFSLRRKKSVTPKELLIENLIFFGSALLTFIIGLIFLVFIGPADNPIIPQSLLFEPFKLYSTFFIAIGVFAMFALRNNKQNEKPKNEINEIGTVL